MMCGLLTRENASYPDVIDVVHERVRGRAAIGNPNRDRPTEAELQRATNPMARIWKAPTTSSTRTNVSDWASGFWSPIATSTCVV